MSDLETEETYIPVRQAWITALRASSRSQNEQGFAIPVAVGIGLITILVATTMMLRSQNDQVTASAQKGTAGGLSAAETGIGRYQSLIAKNRRIATYPDCTEDRSSFNPGTACSDASPTISWSTASLIPGISDFCVNAAPTVSGQAATTWQNVNQGQFRLVSYRYTSTAGTPNTTPGTGSLIVEGRVNQTTTGNGKGLGTATTRLKVDIPVSSGNINNVPVPGAWFKYGGMEDGQTNIANKTVKGNILLNDCSINPSLDQYQAIDTSLTPDGPYIDPSTGQPYTTTRANIAFPPLPTKPTTFPVSNQLGIINTNSTMILPDLTTIPIDTETTVDGITAYRYSVTEIRKGNIEITPGKKVIFYLDGDIDKVVDIRHICGSVPSCSPTDFQVYGYAAAGKMCLNGNNAFQGFIFAPNYSVGVTGTGNIEGSVWAKDFGQITNCSSNNANIVVNQNATWTTLISLGLKFNLPPVTSSASLWQRQEAN